MSADKSSDYDVKVHGVEISPDPVARGQPATFSISASTEKAISGGKLDIDVAYFGWHVHSETHDLCSETSCPGSYSLKMRIMDDNKNQLSCIGFDFSIGLATAPSISEI
ncbi:MD-2-related lipid-recognition protein ROSY1-like protein [Drosera capensis]